MGRRVVHPGTDAVRADKRAAAKKDPAQAARDKAEELHRSGMPFQMAMAVAHGRLALNEALERMARNDRIEKLIKKHDLSRALATQVALGQADLDRVLHRRRFEAHRQEHRDRSILDASAASGDPLVLALHGQEHLEATVIEVRPYEVILQPPGGEPEERHKLQIKFAYAPKDRKAVKKALSWDETLQASPREPIERPQDRYPCSDKRIFRYLDDKAEVQATFLEGERLRGRVVWMSRYEFGLEIPGGKVVTVFRHALAELAAV